MAWPTQYECPDCGATITRPEGARSWGCLCHLGPSCRCRFLDALGCYRCGTMEGFPRHDAESLSDATLNATVLLHGDQTAWERGYTKKELNEKRRVYCDRCIHEQFFLVYTETEVRCRLCGVQGPRGTALVHADGLGG